MTGIATNTANITTPSAVELAQGFGACNAVGMPTTTAYLNGVFQYVCSQIPAFSAGTYTTLTVDGTGAQPVVTFDVDRTSEIVFTLASTDAGIEVGGTPQDVELSLDYPTIESNIDRGVLTLTTSGPIINAGSAANPFLAFDYSVAAAGISPFLDFGVETLTVQGPIVNTGTASDPVLEIDYGALTNAQLDALAAALCGNATFQACINPVPGNPPTAPAGSPFTETGNVGDAINETNGTWGGDTPIALTASGLPAGVTFTDNGDGTYTLTGTYPAAGTYPYTITATNASGSLNTPGNGIVSNAAAALSAVVEFAPTVANPGGADPTSNGNTTILDVDGDTVGSPPLGLNKALMLSVHSFAGGTGPYTVDFSGITWSIANSPSAGLGLSWGAEVFAQANLNSPSVTATATSVAGGAGLVAGTSPAGTTVTGLAAADYATFAPRIDAGPTAPAASALPISVTHQYVAGNVVVTDSLGASVTVPFNAISDSWTVTTSAPPL